MPIIYAFTRKQLAKALKRSVRTSVVAVLNYDGAGEQFATMVSLAKDARRRWQARVATDPNPNPNPPILTLTLTPNPWQERTAALTPNPNPQP